MRCSNCQAENPVDARFCNECGRALARRCDRCGRTNPAGAKFCNECGANLTARPGAEDHSEITADGTANPIRIDHPETASIATDGERKTVTALFADIKGSTELMEDSRPRRGPRAWSIPRSSS